MKIERICATRYVWETLFMVPRGITGYAVSTEHGKENDIDIHIGTGKEIACQMLVQKRDFCYNKTNVLFREGLGWNC